MNRAPVVLYYHTLTQPGGGAERMVCALAQGLADRGFMVHLVSWDPPDSMAFYPIDQRVAWHRLDRGPGLRDKLRRTFALTRLLRRIRAATLVGFVMSGDKTVYAAALLAGIRLVAAERNSPLLYRLRHNWPARLLSFVLLHLADRITVQFPEYADGYPVSLHSRIVAIPNPVPQVSASAKPGHAVSGRFTLLSVGRLDAVQKRPLLLLQAFGRLSDMHPDWDLRIIGDGPERATLEAEVQRLGLRGRVRIEPSTVKISEAYDTAHLFAMTSLWEGFPNALAEAMSHGIPAVGFQSSDGVSHLIRHGSTGWLADGRDSDEAFSKALAQAMMNHAERALRGARAAESMAVFRPDTQYDRWAALLLETASRQ